MPDYQNRAYFYAPLLRRSLRNGRLMLVLRVPMEGSISYPQIYFFGTQANEYAHFKPGQWLRVEANIRGKPRKYRQHREQYLVGMSVQEAESALLCQAEYIAEAKGLIKGVYPAGKYRTKIRIITDEKRKNNVSLYLDGDTGGLVLNRGDPLAVKGYICTRKGADGVYYEDFIISEILSTLDERGKL